MFEMINSINEALDGGFSHSSNVHLAIKGVSGYDDPGDVSFKFNFDFEYRSWGIKDVDFTLLSPSVTIYFDVDKVQRSVEIHKENINIVWTAGRAFTVGDLEVYLNSDLSIADVDLEVFYPKMD